MQDYSTLSVLIVDPNQGMRASVHNMLNQSSITRIEHAVNAAAAIRLLGKKPFDIVLCEYDLGAGADDGQDGQQLLEDLRHHKLIDLLTIFIMLTSEGVHSKVVSAAELAPTDYILKPFTVDVLIGRIERAIERRAIFQQVHVLIGQGLLREAVKACRTGEQAHVRHRAEFLRLRAELHLTLGELAEAEEIYQSVHEARGTGWAALGLARAMFAQERYSDTEDVLTALIEYNPSLMGAYDLLARTYAALGQQAQAKKILEDAVAISPHMVRRLRQLGETAFEAGDIGAAERAFKKVINKAKYSEFRDPEDHLNLVRALVKKGDADQAGNVIRDLERSLRSNANTEACRAISSALLLELTGDAPAAINELSTAVHAVGSSKGLSTKVKISLVRTCLSNKLDKAATDVMLNLMTDADSGMSTDQAVDVFEKAGRHDLAQGMDAHIKKQVQVLMNEAASKANQGEHRAAVSVLGQALRRTPGNLPVLFASVDAILTQLNALGWDAQLAEQAQRQMQTIARLDPEHPTLVELREQYAATQRKYGIAV